MAAAIVPLVNSMLPGHRLKLFDAPVQRLVVHGIKQLCGGVHGL